MDGGNICTQVGRCDEPCCHGTHSQTFEGCFLQPHFPTYDIKAMDFSMRRNEHVDELQAHDCQPAWLLGMKCRPTCRRS